MCCCCLHTERGVTHTRKCLNARQWNFVTHNVVESFVGMFDFNSQSHTYSQKCCWRQHCSRLDSKKVCAYDVNFVFFLYFGWKCKNVWTTLVVLISLLYNILVGSRKYFIFKTFHYRNWANNQASNDMHTQEKKVQRDIQFVSPSSW